jgi:signal transduction histidine kinase
MKSDATELKLRRLLDVGRALVAELDPEVVLDRILEEARQITEARYAALGVINEQRTELERFLTAGVDERTHRAIGDLPTGRGVLGVLIEEPRPLRVADVGQHPRSYGFPAGHPMMRSFLGVPVTIRGQVWGNLYLAEKREGEFTEDDEQAAVVLADWAATAIENARLFQTSERRRTDVERAVRGLEATRDIAIAIGGETDLERVLELIVKRGRALVDARSALIFLREGADLVVAGSAGHAEDVRGLHIPLAESTSGLVFERRRPEVIADVRVGLRIAPGEIGVPDARTALLVPMLHRGQPVALLAAFDRGSERGSFEPEDVELMRAFAATAANAVAMARSVESDRLRSSIAAADAERGRWARELHDETLQGLGGLRVLLASAIRRGEAAAIEQAAREAVDQLEGEIAGLRAIIADLRPAALDDLGLRAALEALLDKRGSGELEIISELELPDPQAGTGRLGADAETTVYRLVQESLTNVVKHAEAQSVRVRVSATNGEVAVEVHDDGKGFDVDRQTSGFGLAGMRERVYLAGGNLNLESGEHGTTVRAVMPV